MLCLASGSGSRLGGPIPKAYVECGGKPLVLRSVERLRRVTEDAEIVLAVNAEHRQPYVEPMLEQVSVRWKLVEMSPGPEGHLLIYVARIDEPSKQGAVMDHLRKGHDGAISAAEMRSLTGLKPRA